MCFNKECTDYISSISSVDKQTPPTDEGHEMWCLKFREKSRNQDFFCQSTVFLGKSEPLSLNSTWTWGHHRLWNRSFVRFLTTIITRTPTTTTGTTIIQVLPVMMLTVMYLCGLEGRVSQRRWKVTVLSSATRVLCVSLLLKWMFTLPHTHTHTKLSISVQ